MDAHPPITSISLRQERGCRRDKNARSLSYFATAPVGVVSAGICDELEELGVSKQTNVRLCLHLDSGNPLQEMVIFQAATRFFPPKRHVDKAKSFTILRGVLGIFWFDATGNLMGAAALSEAGPRICRVNGGIYHVDIPLTATCIHHEVTTGPFRGADDREIASWGPPPQEPAAMARYRAELISRAGFRDL